MIKQASIESIFMSALEKGSPAERQAFLDEACGDQPEIRARVEALLRADSDAGSFLARPASGMDATLAADGDTVNSGGGEVSLTFLQPCDKPGRLGQLDQYEIIEVVGQGGMGAVLRAFDTKLSRVVAVKVMAPELAANPSAVKRFQREATTAAAVVHEHVVTIHAVETSHRPPYLVMQFVEGQTLQQKIDREGALELKQILRIGCQMAAGLAAAHKHGLIHRDVKPCNILLENGVQRVKITDFGLARAADDVEMTKAGTIAGTPQYMSPEQATGEPIDVRSDLFSLGSVLYTMCTGRPAFRAETTLGVLRRVCDDQPRPIREINAEIPPWLEAIVAKLLAKKPADRFQTAAEVGELLSQHLAHVQNPAAAPFPAPLAKAMPAQQDLAPPAPVHSRRQNWSTAAVVLFGLGTLLCVPVALLAIGIGLYFFRGAAPAQVKFGVQSDGSLVLPGNNTGKSIYEQLAEQKRLESKRPLRTATAAEAVDLNSWGRFVDLTKQCRIDRSPSRAVITAPGSRPLNLLPLAGYNLDAPRLMEEVLGDFVVHVQVPPYERPAANSSSRGQGKVSFRAAGLVVWIDEENLLRFERASVGEPSPGYAGGAPYLHVEHYIAGKRNRDELTLLPDDPAVATWLEIERRGEQLKLWVSVDGKEWQPWRTVFVPDLPGRVSIGVAACNSTNTDFSPAFENLSVTPGTK